MKILWKYFLFFQNNLNVLQIDLVSTKNSSRRDDFLEILKINYNRLYERNDWLKKQLVEIQNQFEIKKKEVEQEYCQTL